MTHIRSQHSARYRENSQYGGLFFYLVLFSRSYGSYAKGEDGLAFVPPLFSLPLGPEKLISQGSLCFNNLHHLMPPSQPLLSEHRGLGNLPKRIR